MSSESQARAHALHRIEALERDLGRLALEATRLQGEVAAVRVSVAAITPAAPEPAPREPVEAGADEHDLASARLTALDLVLGGVPRDEAVLRMAVEFPQFDVAALVDEAGAARG